jgi:putative addiction module killer protein
MPEVRKYADERGVVPFDQWMQRIRNIRAKARILNRIDRLSLGLEGDWKSVGCVRELRIPEGKGYRVYYAWDGDAIILLLCGGDKASQQSDIAKAKEYWRSYRG